MRGQAQVAGTYESVLACVDYRGSRVDLNALKGFPERGSNPEELVALGIREYRETFFKPYRIVYHIDRGRVFISLIADGRRDMRSLLARRLLAG